MNLSSADVVTILSQGTVEFFGGGGAGGGSIIIAFHKKKKKEWLCT